MKTLTIRGLPDEVHERLKKSAKENRRSLNQEVIAKLVVEAESRGLEKMERLLLAADQFRAELKYPLSAEDIREAMKEGRD